MAVLKRTVKLSSGLDLHLHVQGPVLHVTTAFGQGGCDLTVTPDLADTLESGGHGHWTDTTPGGEDAGAALGVGHDGPDRVLWVESMGGAAGLLLTGDDERRLALTLRRLPGVPRTGETDTGPDLHAHHL